MMSTVKAVFFDLDGTLYARDAFVRDLFAQQYAAFRDELAGVSRDAFVGRLVELDAHGHGSKPDIFCEACREWGLTAATAKSLVEHFSSDYDNELKADPAVSRLRISEDTKLTLDALKARGKRLGVITNGETKRQQKKLDMLGIASSFDAVLISESEGVRKPAAEIFRRALDRCGGRAKPMSIAEK